MTPATLQALRRLLFFSTEEAAAMIGGVSPRSWQYWERGERRIPEDVAAAMRWLSEWRTQAISSAHDRIEALLADRGEAALVWYPSIDDWLTLPGREPVMWRPQQSVCAALLAEFTGCVTLVAFDGRDYAAWLAGRADNEAMRAQWAAERARSNS